MSNISQIKTEGSLGLSINSYDSSDKSASSDTQDKNKADFASLQSLRKEINS